MATRKCISACRVPQANLLRFNLKGKAIRATAPACEPLNPWSAFTESERLLIACAVQERQQRLLSKARELELGVGI